MGAWSSTREPWYEAEPALSSSPSGAGAISIIITVRVLFLPFSASAHLARLAILRGNHRERYREGGETVPRKSRGMQHLVGAETYTKKQSSVPTSLHVSLIPTGHTHTHTLLRRLIIAGDFHSLHGEPRIEGAAKKQQSSSNTHNHRTLHMSTTSRDAQPIPRGENNQKSSPVNHEDSFALKGSKKYYYPMIFNTQPSSVRPPRATTASNHELYTHNS